MSDESRWDSHEVPTHFGVEDRWIFGRWTTLEGIVGAVAGILCYGLYDVLPDNLLSFRIREMTIPVTAILAFALWLFVVSLVLMKWEGERATTRLYRRFSFVLRPKETVWRPRAGVADRKAVEDAVRRRREEATEDDE